MKKSLLSFLLLLFAAAFVAAQPGPYSGILKFKVYNNGEMIDLSNPDWLLVPAKYTSVPNPKPYQFPDYYQITPKGTPMGGMVQEDFYLYLIHKKDTMKIYTPDFSSENVVLDNIPFSKGTFKIPQHIYLLKELTSNSYENYTPKLNGDWNLFRKETYKCLIERVLDIDEVTASNYNCASYSSFERIMIDNQYYDYNYDFIIKPIDEKNKRIYRVQDIETVSFWNTRKKENKFFIKSLFYRDKTLFAIIRKTYNGPESGTAYGIYKLHFVEDEVPKELALDLKEKQIIEDYTNILKFKEQYPTYWDQYDLKQLKLDCQAKLDSIKD